MLVLVTSTVIEYFWEKWASLAHNFDNFVLNPLHRDPALATKNMNARLLSCYSFLRVWSVILSLELIEIFPVLSLCTPTLDNLVWSLFRSGAYNMVF